MGKNDFYIALATETARRPHAPIVGGKSPGPTEKRDTNNATGSPRCPVYESLHCVGCLARETVGRVGNGRETTRAARMRAVVSPRGNKRDARATRHAGGYRPGHSLLSLSLSRVETSTTIQISDLETRSSARVKCCECFYSRFIGANSLAGATRPLICRSERQSRRRRRTSARGSLNFALSKRIRRVAPTHSHRLALFNSPSRAAALSPARERFARAYKARPRARFRLISEYVRRGARCVATLLVPLVARRYFCIPTRSDFTVTARGSATRGNSCAGRTREVLFSRRSPHPRNIVSGQLGRGWIVDVRRIIEVGPSRAIG